MNILALETSTAYESIALSSNGQIVADVTTKAKRTHSERLLPTVENLLAQTDMKLEDISAIAVSIGPGSFTGLRIGLSTAKGLCFGLKIPLYVTSTLRSLANNASSDSSNICALMDAGRDEYYFAVYSSDLTEIQAPAFAKLDQIMTIIERDSLIIGPVTSKIKQALYATNTTLNFARDINCYPKAVSLIDIIESNKGCDMYEADDIAKVEPLYIRKSAAEENFKVKQRKNKK
jgi:tRNA threonylcarbamoyl adenosine modification protein YeaZ